MKLKIFNPASMPRVKHPGRKPLMRAEDRGFISFSKSLCKALDLKPGDKVEISNDQDDPASWYLSKSKNGFPLRYHGVVADTVCFSSSITARAILNGRSSASFLISTEPKKFKGIKLYPISIKQSQK